MNPRFKFSELLCCTGIVMATLVVTLPVFGQTTSKEQAGDFKNLKQISIGMETYIFEKDDWMPMGWTNASSCLPTDPTQCNFRQMWHFAVYPYLKSWDVMSAPGEPPSGNPILDAFNVSYAYNYSRLSRLCVANDAYSQSALDCPTIDVGHPNSSQFMIPVSAATADNPSRVFMVSDSAGKDLPAPTTIGSFQTTPDCWRSEYYCYGPAGQIWGHFCPSAFQAKSRGGGAILGTFGDTDGFAIRYFGTANVLMIDGHVQPVSDKMATEGIVFSSSLTCPKILSIDKSKSRWEPIYLGGIRP